MVAGRLYFIVVSFKGEKGMKIKRAMAVLALFLLLIPALVGNACTAKPNQSPVVSSLSGDPANVGVGGSSKITCVASDPDGDALQYAWSATAGTVTGSGQAITWTAPGNSGSYSISVAVSDGKGGTASRSYTITVVAPPANRSPVISSLTTNPKVAEPSRPVSVTSIAADPDGDPLDYVWWASNGRFEGTGSKVSWVAPPYPGEYTIELMVRDNLGGVAVQDIKIAVAANQPPQITRLFNRPAKIIPDETARITCTAIDPDADPLTYTWSANGGSITGTGSAIYWTAPGRNGYFTIEVTADDGRGGIGRSSLNVQVEGTKKTWPVSPLPNESGSIYSTGDVYPGVRCGDDNANRGIRAYLSFDLSEITRVEELRSATLNIKTVDYPGNPWAKLGKLSVGTLQYGPRRLQSADYDAQSTRVVAFDAPPIPEIDVTQLVERALNEKVSRFQVTLYFDKETNQDNVSDILEITSAELVVVYITKP